MSKIELIEQISKLPHRIYNGYLVKFIPREFESLFFYLKIDSRIKTLLITQDKDTTLTVFIQFHTYTSFDEAFNFLVYRLGNEICTHDTFSDFDLQTACYQDLIEVITNSTKLLYYGLNFEHSIITSTYELELLNSDVSINTLFDYLKYIQSVLKFIIYKKQNSHLLNISFNSTVSEQDVLHIFKRLYKNQQFSIKLVDIDSEPENNDLVKEKEFGYYKIKLSHGAYAQEFMNCILCYP
jgi:hypothetical protein